MCTRINVLVDFIAEIHLRKSFFQQRAILVPLLLLATLIMMVRGLCAMSAQRLIRAHLLSGALILHQCTQVIACSVTFKEI